MAARIKCKTLTLGSTPSTLKDALGNPHDDYVGTVTFRAKWDNSGTVYWGDGTELGGFLEPKEAASFDLSGKFVYAGHIYLSGTSGDKIYITVVG